MEDENERSKSSDDMDTIVNSNDVNPPDTNKSPSVVTSKKTEKSVKPKGDPNSVFPPMFRYVSDEI